MLRDVLGLVLIAHEAEHVSVHVVLVAEVKHADRVAVARLRPCHGVGDLPIDWVERRVRAKPGCRDLLMPRRLGDLS